MGNISATFTIERLVTAVIVALLAFAGWNFEIERRKADRTAVEASTQLLQEQIKERVTYREVEKVEKSIEKLDAKIEKLINMHVK